jgi:hypothetical protein
MAIRVTDLERENLEAHVDLSAERFDYIDLRITAVEKTSEEHGKSINHLKTENTKLVDDLKNKINNMIISAAGAIIVGLASAVFTFLTK